MISYFQRIRAQDPAGYENEFVRGLRVVRSEKRPRSALGPILWVWTGIAIKCAIVTWAIGHYGVPVLPFWVTAPTVVFGAICSIIYCAAK